MEARAREGSEWVELDFGAGVLRARLARRVSWTPGAEGAPRLGWVAVGWAAVGTIRRDCSCWISLGGWIGDAELDYHRCGWFGW